MKDVVSIGTVNTDIYVNSVFEKETEEKEVPMLVTGGGSAANFAVGCARLGLKAGFHGVIGKDVFGNFLKEDLEKEGVDSKGLMFSEQPSGKVVIITEKRNKNMFAFRGANLDLKKSNLKSSYVGGFKHIHLATVSLDIAEYVVKKFHKTHTISVDPGSTLSSYKLDKLIPVLKYTDVFFPNKEQIHKITNTNYQNGAKKINGVGTKIVAVKLGKEGAYLRTGMEEFHTPIHDIPVVDTTGAGDSFASGFIYSYLKEKNLEDCMKTGIKTSAYCVAGLGARHLPRLSDLKKM
ncbi:MAG: carbohydrate kinase family protein [Candidatus Nanoarchaeia archaeon]|nr:carbohydrate kinase family protein [Candidatus Nanoarchaeia archaeon]